MSEMDFEGALDEICFERIDHDNGEIAYEWHGDIDLYKDTKETINSPTFIKIEGAKAKQYADAISQALQQQSVDVERLKVAFIPYVQILDNEDMKHGWDECVDFMVEKGYLRPPLEKVEGCDES